MPAAVVEALLASCDSMEDSTQRSCSRVWLQRAFPSLSAAGSRLGTVTASPAVLDGHAPAAVGPVLAQAAGDLPPLQLLLLPPQELQQATMQLFSCSVAPELSTPTDCHRHRQISTEHAIQCQRRHTARLPDIARGADAVAIPTAQEAWRRGLCLTLSGGRRAATPGLRWRWPGSGLRRTGPAPCHAAAPPLAAQRRLSITACCRRSRLCRLPDGSHPACLQVYEVYEGGLKSSPESTVHTLCCITSLCSSALQGRRCGFGTCHLDRPRGFHARRGFHAAQVRTVASAAGGVPVGRVPPARQVLQGKGAPGLPCRCSACGHRADVARNVSAASRNTVSSAA